MRPLLLTVTVLGVLAVSSHAAQEQPQRFRAAVDLITVDVTAVDAKG